MQEQTEPLWFLIPDLGDDITPAPVFILGENAGVHEELTFLRKPLATAFETVQPRGHRGCPDECTVARSERGGGGC